ncbi:YlbF family regulator [Tepidibacter thalassicus]|uniref:Control of competence regulator ComK, YlbF/YmcA n=1 Tax=Tepidibacter thalassicus DSM 15285 TaxID=1123350 RepID=A0A1M5SN65_9FIRM|nr:YlbF family regulator [Tepidibacter thalassicus]SHH39967.1 Control of competence regulator ComK, YlbF/YmcA [Tepidibacter thalassicus DSM 15285]
MSGKIKTKEFIDSIINTSEFKQLKKAKAAIDKNKDLKKKVDDFRKKQMEIYSSKKTQKDIQFKLNELNRKFQNLSQIKEVNIFLKSTKDFNDMMYRVFEEINNSIESKLNSK